MSRQVIVIFGPPGAGKTTLAHTYDLPIYDRDDPKWRSEQQFTQALRRIGQDPRAQAVVIRSGASAQSRSRTRTMVNATDARILETDPDTCIRRIRSRSRGDITRQIAGVRQWWRDYTKRPMSGPDPRETRAWRKLRDQVVREEPICQLQLPGCTTISTTADHIETVKDRPDLAMERANHQGACRPCNQRRNDKKMSELKPRNLAKALDFFA